MHETSKPLRHVFSWPRYLTDNAMTIQVLGKRTRPEDLGLLGRIRNGQNNTARHLSRFLSICKQRGIGGIGGIVQGGPVDHQTAAEFR